MKSLPIVIKILLVLSLLGLIALGAVGYMALQLRQTAYAGDKIATTTMQAALVITQAQEKMQHARGDMLSTEITLTPADNTFFENQTTQDLKGFNEKMSAAARLAPIYAEEINTLHQQGNDLFSNTCRKTIEMAAAATTEQGNQAAQQEALNDGCLKSFDPYNALLRAMQNKLVNKADQEYKNLNTDTIHSLTLSCISLFLAIIVISFISFLVVKKYITAPLDRLGQAMHRLSGGDLSTKIPETNRRDEVGKMANMVLVFQKIGIDKEKAEQASQKAKDEAEAERKRREVEKAEISAAQEFVVNSLANGLKRLSTGDLVFRLTEEFSSDYEKLRIDFNNAISNLQKTMNFIEENTYGVENGTREIMHASDDLSRRTETQAASLEQTAAALDEITSATKKSSEMIKEVYSLANEAKTDAEHSGVVVNKTVIAIDEIKDSSQKISNIISIIDEIAFKTNLLALNAGVEAARAGEAGRGFAVVATEVRALAQRSADASKEIKALITASSTQVHAGVDLVNETGQALNRIVNQVTRLNILITDITTASSEQSMALAEINIAVNEMDQATQKNAAMAEESTAATHALSDKAESLKHLVKQFRTHSEADEQEEDLEEIE